MPVISLKPLHTFQLDHGVFETIIINQVEQLERLKGYSLNRDFILVGQGSNCVFLEDIKIPVVVNKLSGIKVNETENAYYIEVASGEDWHHFVDWSIDQGMYGLENLALIPGTVGASPIQNIGAYGKEVKDYIDSVTYYDLLSGKMTQLNNAECDFNYRDSIFKNQLRSNAIVTSVQFRLPKKWRAETSYGELKSLSEPTARQIFNRVCEVRKLKLPDPKVKGNAGSFFKNPIVKNEILMFLLKDYPNMPHYRLDSGDYKLAAGWLIDQCGLKGVGNENVVVHSQQALVLTNASGKAKGADLVQVAKRVQSEVKTKFEIELEPEVRFFGSLGEVLLDYQHD
jgi:UDP-N-acetylmuramate dehydrogenase